MRRGTSGPPKFPEGRHPCVALVDGVVRVMHAVFTERSELLVPLDDTRDAWAISADVARVFATRPPHLARIAEEIVRLRDAARATRLVG